MTRLESFSSKVTRVSMTRVEQFDGYALQSLAVCKSKVLAKQGNLAET
jgi:hypothetical protein